MKGKKLLLPLMVAALLRFSGLAWDSWHHQHPDEDRGQHDRRPHVGLEEHEEHGEGGGRRRP